MYLLHLMILGNFLLTSYKIILKGDVMLDVDVSLSAEKMVK